MTDTNATTPTTDRPLPITEAVSAAVHAAAPRGVAPDADTLFDLAWAMHMLALFIANKSPASSRLFLAYSLIELVCGGVDGRTGEPTETELEHRRYLEASPAAAAILADELGGKLWGAAGALEMTVAELRSALRRGPREQAEEIYEHVRALIGTVLELDAASLPLVLLNLDEGDVDPTDGGPPAPPASLEEHAAAMKLADLACEWTRGLEGEVSSMHAQAQRARARVVHLYAKALDELTTTDEERAERAELRRKLKGAH
jgi:hypothetical protein